MTGKIDIKILLLTAVTLIASAQAAPKPIALPILDPGFEREGAWTLELRDGAKGTLAPDAGLARSGKRSLRIAKENGFGAVVVRPAAPLTVPAAGRYFFRVYFHADNAPLSSLLLLRVCRDLRQIGYDSTFDRSAGYSANSLIVNAPAGRWEKRVMSFAGKAGEKIWPMIVLWGNPATVWIDDASIDTVPQALPHQDGPPLSPKLSAEEVLRRLKSRPDATARVLERNGTGVLEIDGQAAPILYKANPYSAQVGDYAAFGRDGVPTATVGIRLGQFDKAPRIWIGSRQYDFAQADQALIEALRRNPEARLILEVGVYPYLSWGKEHPEECWTDHEGKRGFGTWGNLEGFAGSDLEAKRLAGGRAIFWYPSYCSSLYRAESGEALRKLIEHLRTTPLWKAVVGVFIGGGQDGNFLFPLADYSRPAVLAFRQWCREKYGTIGRLNAAWKTQLADFDQITIPASGRAHALPPTPYLPCGAAPDYQRFATEATFRLRDHYGEVCKKAAGKDIVTWTYSGGDCSVYGSYLRDLKYIDIFGHMTHYPYRNPGLPLGFLVPTFPPGRPRMFFQEIDLRSWVGSVYGDEVYQRWIGAGLDPQKWQAINRKLVGLSMAGNLGFWYYDMNRYFNDPRIHESLARTVRVARDYFRQPPSAVRPDVAVVIGEEASPWIRMGTVYPSSGCICPAMQYQVMHLETSGVPFDVRFLSDLLARPSEARYKVYLFYGLPRISEADRAKMDQVFKGRGQTLVWMYDTGYLTDQDKSVEAMSKLIGMTVRTKEQLTRLTALTVNPALNPLLKGVPPYLGASELVMAMFTLKGSTSFAEGYQPFWIADDRAEVLARYHETGEAAAARRSFNGWTSIYMAAPHGLDAAMLNNIAGAAGAYRCGGPGQAIYMNGRFASLHGLRAQKYTFTLPPGTRRVIDPETGKILADGVKEFTISVQPQETYWYLFE